MKDRSERLEMLVIIILLAGIALASQLGGTETIFFTMIVVAFMLFSVILAIKRFKSDQKIVGISYLACTLVIALLILL